MPFSSPSTQDQLWLCPPHQCHEPQPSAPLWHEPADGSCPPSAEWWELPEIHKQMIKWFRNESFCYLLHVFVALRPLPNDQSDYSIIFLCHPKSPLVYLTLFPHSDRHKIMGISYTLISHALSRYCFLVKKKKMFRFFWGQKYSFSVFMYSLCLYKLLTFQSLLYLLS